MSRSAILLITCPDRQGLVATVTEFIHKNRGNIVHLDEHVDEASKVFFMRVEWRLEGFVIPEAKIGEYFQTLLANGFDMRWSLHYSDEVPKMALFVSKIPHCLYDILSRCDSGEWQVDIPVIVSNHPDLRPVAERFGKEFAVIPVDAASKDAREEETLALLERKGVDFVVLARYMQTLTGRFVARYPSRIINIHHSFLPAFPGAKPYHSAHARGVKVIGATSHYVTEELDAGPIIQQDIAHVSHQDAVEDLIRKGRDLEKIVLARAVWSHLQRKVLVHGNRTVVFS
jgi:formyltetrahydrofolate deformylase